MYLYEQEKKQLKAKIFPSFGVYKLYSRAFLQLSKLLQDQRNRRWQNDYFMYQ